MRNRRVLDMVAVLVRWIYRHCDLLLVQSQAFISPVKAMAGKTPVQYHPNPGELAFDQAGSLGPPALVLEPGFGVMVRRKLGYRAGTGHRAGCRRAFTASCGCADSSGG